MRSEGLVLQERYRNDRRFNFCRINSLEIGSGISLHSHMEPISNAAPSADQAPSGKEGGEILIYVVDDESLIGEVVEVVLKLKGFRPRFFSNPEEALQSLANEEEKPVLLLTDFIMSPINGMELIERCKKIQPSLKTVLYSGNVDEDITHYYSVKPDGFLSKPFLPKDLVATVQSVLRGES